MTTSTAPATSPTDIQESRNTEATPEDTLRTPASSLSPATPGNTITTSPLNTDTTAMPEPSPRNQTSDVVDVPSDPRIAPLKAMFPDFDDAVLSSVLDSVGGDQDAAIDTLLGMSDPNYMSEARPREPVISQTELDEQFARQLYIQDEQRQRTRWEAQQRPPPVRQSSQHAGEKDVMTEVSEQFKQITETGRKTFGNIMSKVKAKISEYDQQRQSQGQPSSQAYHGPAVGGDSYPQQPNDPQHQPYQHPPQSQAQQPAFYDPNALSPTNHDPSERISSASSQEPRGYDASSADLPSTATPPPPSTGSGIGLDTGKLGLLPKRPVSLLPQANQTSKPADEDDLEYVENPFEDKPAKK
ncbi:hypothetical protein E1B28_008576 [Marasmius oreades]|uniref:CUE domain-containing protein n=1 Tax=Marasmius oreades TaxID=181124 RepID=A0A9P7UUF2_9AGAR|nr:uncharacterized protein E1B28_008576 [Marasmius oreades]KAG7092209.1 hypothetical protein E1B28_008576 [Marasmius oreades]